MSLLLLRYNFSISYRYIGLSDPNSFLDHFGLPLFSILIISRTSFGLYMLKNSKASAIDSSTLNIVASLKTTYPDIDGSSNSIRAYLLNIIYATAIYVQNNGCVAKQASKISYTFSKVATSCENHVKNQLRVKVGYPPIASTISNNSGSISSINLLVRSSAGITPGSKVLYIKSLIKWFVATSAQ